MDTQHLKELEAAATPAPWFTKLASEVIGLRVDVGTTNRVVMHTMQVRPWRPDDGPKDFVIADPVDAEDALFIEALRNAASELLALAERAAAMEALLAWYANTDHWRLCTHSMDDGWRTPIERDGGAKARTALAASAPSSPATPSPAASPT